MSTAERLLAATRALAAELAALTFAPPVSHVYNPLDYAGAMYRQYLERYGAGPKQTLFVGMNPGPWGMAQTGVPFGEVSLVRDWLKLAAPIGKPPVEHPKRPVEGLACTRAEVSGTRVWGAVARHWGSPEAFFADNFVLAYCPLLFLEASGKNRTPEQLPVAEKRAIARACDQHLRAAVEALAPRRVIGIGNYAEGRIREALAGLPLQIGRIPHPSPASPTANRGWEPAVREALEQQGFGCAPKSP